MFWPGRHHHCHQQSCITTQSPNSWKSSNNIKADKVKVSWLSQSKLYLKIIGIFYLLENTNTSISADIVESIIQSNYILNNIAITSRPCIIKVSLKFDIAIIWLDIWDVQSSSNAKGLINRCFNIGSYITTICWMNINLGVPQYKNCWKQSHVTFSCRIQGSRCIKCNGLHKTKHYHQFA